MAGMHNVRRSSRFSASMTIIPIHNTSQTFTPSAASRPQRLQPCLSCLAQAPCPPLQSPKRQDQLVCLALQGPALVPGPGRRLQLLQSRLLMQRVTHAAAAV